MGFASESRERVRPVLPLAGMVDILFLLLIFFITASTFKEQEPVIEINPPVSGEGQPPSNTANALVINLTAEREIFVSSDTEPRSFDDVAQLFQDSARLRLYDSVVIRGDTDTTYGLYRAIEEAAHDAGFRVEAAVIEAPEGGTP